MKNTNENEGKQRIQIYVNNNEHERLKRLCKGKTLNDFVRNCINVGLNVLEPEIIPFIEVKEIINKQYMERNKTKLILKKITWVSNIKSMLKNLKMQGVETKDLTLELIPQLKREGELLGADTTFLSVIVADELINYEIVECPFMLVKEI